jgi:hypothetical protein
MKQRRGERRYEREKRRGNKEEKRRDITRIV